MTFFLKDKVCIPTEWTGEQALATLEFLDAIGSAIWNVHEKGLLKAMKIERSMLERDAHDDELECIHDDDIPF